MFPKEQTQAVKQALCGFFTQLKAGIANGFSSFDRKFMKNKNKQEDSGNDTKRDDNEKGVDHSNNNNNNNKANEMNDVAINN